MYNSIMHFIALTLGLASEETKTIFITQSTFMITHVASRRHLPLLVPMDHIIASIILKALFLVNIGVAVFLEQTAFGANNNINVS